MRDGRSRPDGAHSQPISARVTRETREAVERLAEENYRGQTSVATREAVLGGLAREHHRQAAEHLADRNTELREQREELREENDELRARFETPSWADWIAVTRNGPPGLRPGLFGVVVTFLGIAVSLLSVWAETTLPVSPPEWTVRFGFNVSFFGVSVVLAVPVVLALFAAARWVGGRLGD
jgi:hypothetical protein